MIGDILKASSYRLNAKKKNTRLCLSSIEFKVQCCKVLNKVSEGNLKQVQYSTACSLYEGLEKKETKKEYNTIQHPTDTGTHQ